MEKKVKPLADGEKVKLLVIDGADHFFRDLYSEEATEAIAEFIREWGAASVKPLLPISPDRAGVFPR